MKALFCPLFIISGSEDPFGEYGKGTTRLYEMYKGIGITDVELKLYEGGRHEMINEINKEQVYEDITNCLMNLFCRLSLLFRLL